MGHLIIYFYFIVFTTGFSLIFLGSFIWLVNKQDKLKYFILSVGALTLILFEQAVTAYDTINGVKNIQLSILLRYISTFGCTLMIYAITRLVMKLLDILCTKRRILLLGIYSVLPLLGVTVYYTTSQVLFLRVSSILYFGSILFNIIILIENMSKIDNIIIKSAIRKIIMISLFMFPILFVDTILEKMPIIGKEFPLGLLSVMIYYSIVCGISLYYIIRNFHKIIGTLAEKSNPSKEEMNILSTVTMDSDNIKDIKILVKYKITNREREIIDLLICGNSYKEISEKLVITLPTVKTHVFNIYKKLGIKNKIELINLLTLDKKQYENLPD